MLLPVACTTGTVILVHAAEHASLLGTGLLFWWVALRPLVHPRGGSGVEVALLFGMAVQGAGLGALMAFARWPWYAAYGETTAPWGLTPLEDQQVAGLMMLMAPGLVYAGTALAVLAVWLQAAERTATDQAR
jgi:cytochrome c oxidase assembly factor CtaG